MLFFLALYVIHLVSNKSEKKALKIVIFLIPFNITPLTIVGINLNFAGLMIWSIFIGRMISKQYIHNLKNGLTINVLYYFLISGIIFGIININERFDYFSSNILNVTPQQQIINVSLFIITSIYFIKLLYIYKYDSIVLY